MFPYHNIQHWIVPEVAAAYGVGLEYSMLILIEALLHTLNICRSEECCILGYDAKHHGRSSKKFACRLFLVDYFTAVSFDPEDIGSTFFRTHVDFYQAIWRHITGDSTPHRRRCEIQQFSLCSLLHAETTLALVGAVTHGHTVYGTDRKFALVENPDKTLNFLNTKYRKYIH